MRERLGDERAVLERVAEGLFEARELADDVRLLAGRTVQAREVVPDRDVAELETCAHRKGSA